MKNVFKFNHSDSINENESVDLDFLTVPSSLKRGRRKRSSIFTSVSTNDSELIDGESKSSGSRTNSHKGRSQRLRNALKDAIPIKSPEFSNFINKIQRKHKSESLADAMQSTTRFATAAAAALATSASMKDNAEEEAAELARLEEERKARYISWKAYADEKRKSKKRRNARLEAACNQKMPDKPRSYDINAFLNPNLNRPNKPTQPVSIPKVEITNENGDDEDISDVEREKKWMRNLADQVCKDFVNRNKINQV
jgi:hypothetical protein